MAPLAQPPLSDRDAAHAADAPAVSMPGGPRLDAVQGLLTLLPLALLLGGVVYGVPTHTSAAAGWILPATLPCLLAAFLRRGRGDYRALILFAPVLLLTLSTWATDASDSFEAERARVTLTAWLALLVSGACLGPTGRGALARGALLLSLVGLVTAWVDTALDPVRAFAGALENSGDLSEALLAGALVGSSLATRERGVWRAGGLACAGLYLFTVGHVPVVAGGVSFLAAAGLASLRGRAVDRRFLVLAAILLVTGFVVGRGATAPADAGEVAQPAAGEGSDVVGGPSEVSPSFGGVAFRQLTWPRVVQMVRARGATGAGQFAREFPPYRDPREIELSSHGRRSPTSTEVEHAHNDWLQAFAEYGVVGGLAWLAFGIYLAWRAFRATAQPDVGGPDAGLAVGALGLLVNASFNSPFFEGPAHAIAAPLFGTLLAAPRRSTAARGPGRAAVGAGLIAPLGALALAAVQVPAALAFIHHGRALGRLTRPESTTVVDGRVVHRVEAKRAAIEAALGACPTSTTARVERAHLLRVEAAPAEEQLELWLAILDARPYHFEALLSAANLGARLERFEEAQDLYQRAAQLDPLNPTLIRNRLLCALRAGDVESVLDALADESSEKALDMAWLERSAAELLLSGRPHLGLPLLERSHPEMSVTSAEEAYALSKTVDVDLLADALLAHAHFTWAREHALAGDATSASRSYRQSLGVANRYPDLVGGARRVRMELAAALSLRGEREKAATGMEGLNPTSVDLEELPAWARHELRAQGWIGE